MTRYAKVDVLRWLQGLSNGILELTEDNAGLADSAMLLIEPSTEFPDEPLPAGYISPHFKLSEFTYSDTANAQGIDNTPGEAETVNLSRVAETLEAVRTLLGSLPITITSGYRCPDLNAAVGGASSSAHLYGLAADFVCPDYGDPTKICNALLSEVHDLQIDQLINESNSAGGKWVHIGLSEGAPRGECLTIGAGGTQVGIV